MQRFIVLALMGLAAQMVDGALGMAYGLTSTTLLLTIGLTPALASASVHLAEVGTTLASGAAHWKLGNVDWRTVRWMAVPGGVGAFFGAVVLSSISAESARPAVAVFLTLLGAYVLIRFAFMKTRPTINRAISGRFLVPLGLGAGFLDAAGGGGWGPISTPTLLASGRMEPRRVIGTVDTSEFIVALSASVGFLISLDRTGIAFSVVGALLLGGLIAAPIAAWLVRYLHPRILGTAVGGLIIFTNSRTLLKEFGLSGEPLLSAYALIGVAWVAALVLALNHVRRERLTGGLPDAA
jgi:uncharacterized membrane protein YfcA